MLNARIAIVATVVVGQLWGLTVALNAWLEHRMGQVWLLLAFQVLSFALAVAAGLREALGLTVPVDVVEAGSLPRFEMKASRFIVEG